MGNGMSDFFISYTSADKDWAEWIGYVLEDGGYSVSIQAWDFRPGSNFVLEMQKAAAEAARTVMVLSPDYMKSQFASPEWAAAFARDPQGIKRSLLPVTVRECRVTGLLAPLVHIDISRSDETAARKLLLEGVNDTRAKPARRPTFPGASSQQPRSFPGLRRARANAPPQAYIPSVRMPPSDVEKRKYSRHAFETIKSYFEGGLSELAVRSGAAIEVDLQTNASSEFTAEIFLTEKSTCFCRIWQGGLHSVDGISYAEGRQHFGRNACNEILVLAEGKDGLHLEALMGTSFGGAHDVDDLKNMTGEQAASYLWRRFVRPLERR